jgi:hypothetical protein
MGAIIAKQPNGLYCRVSTVVDAPTHYNMTKQDYIDYCVEQARQEAEEILSKYCKDFEYALDFVQYGKNTNMTKAEYDKFIKDTSK